MISIYEAINLSPQTKNHLMLGGGLVMGGVGLKSLTSPHNNTPQNLNSAAIPNNPQQPPKPSSINDPNTSMSYREVQPENLNPEAPQQFIV